ncbi:MULTISPECIES: amidase [unclassified Burkholderia]|uniref:amidase n=1 Tax=unclassified Burkholderia TaxID=2613784 RepID=UPI002AB301C3|nr:MULTISPECIES: amidase [unclassified Burkholderia]
MENPKLTSLSATEAMVLITTGDISARELLEASIERIDEREPEIRAWSHLDFEGARERADLADRRRRNGEVLGALHGLPVGVKDVFDTHDMPSEYGSRLYRGRVPSTDAAAVTVLRNAGAVIVGKTTTSEFGMYHPPETRNPRDISRSPGVSSSGAAASVVDFMVPLGLGTQHTASTTLPASFCGAFAFKPSFGFTDMSGSNILIPRLSHLGLLARSVDDLSLFASAYQPSLRKPLDASLPPRIAVVHGPGWSRCSEDARQALHRFADDLKINVSVIEMDDSMSSAPEVTMSLLDAHMSYRFGTLPPSDLAQLCGPLRQCVEDGSKISASQYIRLNATIDGYAEAAQKLLDEFDAVITLSACGEATTLEEGPGSGVMSMFWSLCGLPTVSLPFLTGASGLPIGIQVIAGRNSDGKLLQVAKWIELKARGMTR